MFRSHFVLRMEELDRALFTDGGTARGAYSPLIDLDLDVSSVPPTVADHHSASVSSWTGEQSGTHVSKAVKRSRRHVRHGKQRFR